jgi:peptide deformylase
MSQEIKPLTIITFGHPTLRVKCAPVTVFDDKLRELSEQMMVTMHENDGVGLAASQVNIKIQMLVVDVPIKDSDEHLRLTVVNPQIVESGGTWDFEEGCLSIPEVRDTVTRPEWIRLKFQDVDGTAKEIRADGMLARVLQHEIDHLNGILFVDHLSPLRRALLNSKLKALAKENANVCV